MDVQKGGRVLACGYRDETPKAGSLIDLGPESAGSVSLVGMSWAATPSKTRPFINLESFKGTLGYVGNSIGSGYGENDGSFFVRIAGDGGATRLLCAADEFSSVNSTTVPKVWQDASSPKAEAFLDNCIGGEVNQKKYDIPNVAPQGAGAEPDEKAMLDMLSQIRGLRIEPPAGRPEGVTDVKLLRVQVLRRPGANRISFQSLNGRFGPVVNVSRGPSTPSARSVRSPRDPSRRRQFAEAFDIAHRRLAEWRL